MSLEVTLEGSARGTLARTISIAALKAGILLALILRAMTLFSPVIDDDEAWFSAQALAMKTPGEYFSRALDNKPPGTAWFYWICREIFGDASLPRTARAVNLVLLALSAWGVGILARRLKEHSDFSGGSGLSASLLFLLVLPLASPKCLSVTNESLMIPLLVGAMMLVWPKSQASLWRYLAAGALVGASVLFKQTGIFFCLPLAFAAKSSRDLIAIGMGAAALLGAAVLVLGPADTWHWCFVYPSEILTAARGQIFSSAWEGLTSALHFIVALLPVLLAAGSYKKHAALTVPLAWFVAAAAAVALGKGIFLHYFLLLLPPLCLLVEPERVLSGWRAWWLWAGYLFACIVAAVSASGLFWGNDLGYFSRVAERARQVTVPNEPVLFWGGNPVPVALSLRPGVGRFFTARFAAPPYATPETERLFEEDFRRKPPVLVVDLHVRGDNRFDHPVETLPWLAELLRDRYAALADPGLPWARFFVERTRAQALLANGFCATAPSVWQVPSDEYPESLAKAMALKASRSPREMLVREHSLRESFAAEISHRVCASGLPDARRGTFPLASPTWWLSLAIVEMQPTSHRK